MEYDIGDTYPATVKIVDAAGAPINPATVTLTITQPDGTTVPGTTVANPPAVTGTFTYDHVITMAGRYHLRWQSTGPATAFTDVFDVRSQTLGIISLRAAKEHIKMELTNVEFDEQFRTLIDACTEIIEHYAGAVVRRTATETLDGGRRAIPLGNDPIISISGVTEQGIALTPDQWDFKNGLLTRLAGPYTAGRWLDGVSNVVVSEVIGLTVIPANLLLAAKILFAVNSRPIIGGSIGSYEETTDINATVDTREGERRSGYWVPRGVISLITPDEEIGGVA